MKTAPAESWSLSCPSLRPTPGLLKSNLSMSLEVVTVAQEATVFCPQRRTWLSLPHSQPLRVEATVTAAPRAVPRPKTGIGLAIFDPPAGGGAVWRGGEGGKSPAIRPRGRGAHSFFSGPP